MHQLCFIIFTPAAVPQWTELIEIKQWDGFCKRSIAASIALNSKTQCDIFASLLLGGDPLLVEATRREKPDNVDFIHAILRIWYAQSGSAVSYTWRDLVDCMKRAGLNEVMVKTIEDNIY